MCVALCRYLVDGVLCLAMRLPIPGSLITVESPAQSTRRAFGAQLPDPFTTRAGAGSHLPRLSVPRSCGYSFCSRLLSYAIEMTITQAYKSRQEGKRHFAKIAQVPIRAPKAPHCHSERSEESRPSPGCSLFVLRTCCQRNRATWVLRDEILHCVQNDKDELWVLVL